MKFEILKNVPIPENVKDLTGWKRSSKYPFGEMEIGDCIKFKADDNRDINYKRIYSAAMSYARRLQKGFTFVFGKIDEGFYGCWKVQDESNSPVQENENSPVQKKKYSKRQSTTHINKTMLISALERDGSLAGAARDLNISTRTLSRLKKKFELV